MKIFFWGTPTVRTVRSLLYPIWSSRVNFYSYAFSRSDSARFTNLCTAPRSKFRSVSFLNQENRRCSIGLLTRRLDKQPTFRRLSVGERLLPVSFHLFGVGDCFDPCHIFYDFFAETVKTDGKSNLSLALPGARAPGAAGGAAQLGPAARHQGPRGHVRGLLA